MLLLSTLIAVRALSVLSVGDGKTYSRIGDALAAAKAGDTIEVYPKDSGYEGEGLRVTTPRLTIRGVGPKRVIVNGEGFDYSGVGSIPRAIFQVDPGADNVLIEHFELVNAHNGSFNGSGVRINAANHVTIRDCDIHDNDMGIMSGGRNGDPTAATDQDIDRCVIHENGTMKDPGYNHNLYLGGTSATIERSEIYGSLTGHNLKSRAHYNLVRYCFIHDSANREMDFVEAGDTERANSNVVLIGNVIVKDPNCKGNRVTIHFGVEKGKRNGTLFLINNTIVTPFMSGVVALSTPQGSVQFFNNVIVNSEQSGPHLVEVSNGANLGSVSGANNWISSGYSLDRTKIGPSATFVGSTRQANPLSAQFAWVGAARPGIPTKYVDGIGQSMTASVDSIYVGNDKWIPTKARFIGAG